MDSDRPGNVDSKTEFRKPLSDSANRKYRRRSPVNGSSSSSGGSPNHDRIPSPIQPRKDAEEVDSEKKRKNGHGDLDRESSRSKYSRSGEFHRHSDRNSRSFHSFRTHDDYRRREKHMDDYDRDYPKSSSRSSRNSRDYCNSDHSRRDYEHRSREHPRDVDKNFRDKADSFHRSRDKDKDSSSNKAGTGRRYTSIDEGKAGEGESARDDREGRDRKTDHRRGSGDHKSDDAKETFWRDTEELDGDKSTKDERRRYDDRNKYKEQHSGEPEEHSEDQKASLTVDEECAKRSTLFSSDSKGSVKATLADGRSSGSEQAQEASGTVSSQQAYVTDSDIDAAKIAAMKAAELVNRNLVGTGYMSTDQKKKLLWGKKNTTTEESARHWDTATFGDQERQEKFNKLMGVKGDARVEQKQDNPDVEKQREQLQLDLEKQYTAGLRRRDGRTVGLGL